MEPVSLPSDMQMVETQSKPAQPYQEVEEPRQVRTPRPRRQPLPEEPMQQVETGGQSAGSDGAS